jgi:SNF2 family DNA or RNA helicase
MTTIEQRLTSFTKYLDYKQLDHKQYQYDGVKWIINNELCKNPVCCVRGGFIADEMGLGKTIMIIGALLCNFLPRTLIVLPPALIDQWLIQIYRTTGHKALIYHGSAKKHISLEMLNKAIIVITTYGAITLTKKQLKVANSASEDSLLHQVNWSRIVFDEAHHLRNSNTTLFKSVRLMSARIRWLVSGTPIQNKKKDFYNLCSILRIPASFYKNEVNLPTLAHAFILKRTKKSVGIEMDDVVVEKNIVTWLNHNEMELSEDIHSGLSFSNKTSKSNLKSGIQAITFMLLARQMCVYPNLLSSKIKKYVSGDFDGALKSTSKLDYVVKKILERKDNGCGKIVFCHFRAEIDTIADRLRMGGMTKIATFDGRTSHGKRSEILTSKNDVLILQIQTGCEGLNLQENYSEVYFVSAHWNPAVEDQAVARCHRIGQTKTVYVERFEMGSFEGEECNSISVDNYIATTQDNKRLIASSIIG